MTGGAAPRFTPAALARFLFAPEAAERLSAAAGGAGALVLELPAECDAETRHALPVLQEQLPILPCVTIASVRGASELSLPAPPAPVELRRLAEICDVQLGGPASVGGIATDAANAAGIAGHVPEQEPNAPAVSRLLHAIAQAPIASLAFVQLLRGGPPATLHAGLVAESFVYSTLQSGAEFRSWLSKRQRRRKRRTSLERIGDRARALLDSGDPGPACRLRREGATLELRLARPDKHNAFSRAMRDALAEGLQLALCDASIDDVVLCGEGDSFCSGGDLDEFGSFPDPAMAHATRTTRSPALLITRLAGRIRSEVHGACVGAGMELPAFTDRVVAREDAFFALPEVSLGLVPGAGGTVSLPRRIGRQRTAWLGLSGERIDARTALDWGLVDEIRLGQHVESDRNSRPEKRT